MNLQQRKWLFLVLLSLVWGSSYILIKKALLGFDPISLGALRITFSAVLLLMIGFSSLKKNQEKPMEVYLLHRFFRNFFSCFFIFVCCSRN